MKGEQDDFEDNFLFSPNSYQGRTRANRQEFPFNGECKYNTILVTILSTILYFNICFCYLYMSFYAYLYI
jgi:hypothetical protein